jgi:general secretion pathway protein H
LGTPKPPAKGSERQSGFTLLEVLVVIAIGGLIMGSAVRGFRSLAKSDLRSATAKLSGAMRYLFDRASTTGKQHRLVLDLNEGRYWAEVSDDRFYIPSELETEASRRKEAEEVEKERQEAERAAEEKAETGFDMSKIQAVDFRPKRARFAAFKETAIKPVTIKNAKIAGVFTPRMAEAATSGRAYIYFFPLGQTEAAIVHVSDAKDESTYSIVAHPITGRVRVYNEYVKPPVGDQVDDTGNRIEP